MSRWLTPVVLTGLALIVGLLAPTLLGPPQGPVEAEPTMELHTPPSEYEDPSGLLLLAAGLDRHTIVPGDDRFVVVEVSAPPDLGQHTDRPLSLAVVVDASGSMSARGKLDVALRSAKTIANNLDERDRFSLVAFSDGANVIVPSTPVTDVQALSEAIGTVYAGGGTNLYGGISEGVEQVRQSLDPWAVGRVIVLSDGYANIGLTDPHSLYSLADRGAEAGVSISTIGLGRDHNEEMLAKISDIGGGHYDFVDRPGDLIAALDDEFERTRSVVARDLRVSVALPSNLQLIDVFGWDVTASGRWTEVYLGDLHAGETRKIVARVRGNAPSGQTAERMEVKASYEDLTLQRYALDTTTAPVHTTDSQRLSALTEHPGRALAARKAQSAWYLDQSAALYRSGDRSGAIRLASEGRGAVTSVSGDVSDPDISAAAELLQQLKDIGAHTPPSSFAGRGLLKSAKEESRDLAR